MKSIDKDIKKALLKKAMGYTATEIVEEYANTDDGMVLQKKKVTSKDIPPDLSTFKLLLDGEKEKGEFDDMTDQELIAEKERLIKLLDKKENLWKTKIEQLNCL